MMPMSHMLIENQGIVSDNQWAYRKGHSTELLLAYLTDNDVVGVALITFKGVVSKETVVLRRWGSSIQKFGFINGVDNVNWPPYRDSKS